MKVACCVGYNQTKGQLTGDEFRVVMAFRKNAAVIKDMKIFAGEVWVPKPAYVSPPIPPPPPNFYGQLQTVVGAIVVAAILKLSVLRTLI